MYWVTLYGSDDIEVKTWTFGTKAEQLEKYYNLVSRYGKSRAEKGKYIY